MKNILIQSQAILLAFIAFPTVFYTSNSEARINRGISPTTGVYDPNCDDAKVWDVKLIDHDGDGVPDEDRQRSGLKSAGFVLVGPEGNRSRGSTFTVGKRHVVTVGHLFARNGQRIPGTDEVAITLEGCPGQTYIAKHIHLKTTNIPNDRASIEDYAVIELDREFCEDAGPLPFGAPRGGSVLNLEAYATGYYRLSDLNPPTASNDTPKEGSTVGGQRSSDSREFQQFTSIGSIIKSGLVDGQLIYQYQMGQTKGGSGGPIIGKVNGQLSVIGMQFYQPAEGLNFNLAIAMQGPFSDFVQSIVGND